MSEQGCTTAQKFTLNPRDAFLLMLLLENNIAPESFGEEASGDLLLMVLSEGISKGIPFAGNITTLYEWYETGKKRDLDKIYKALGYQNLANLDDNNGTAFSPITFTIYVSTWDLGEYGQVRHFLLGDTPNGPDWYIQHPEVIVTIANVDGSRTSGPSVIAGNSAAILRDILRFLTQ